MIKPYTKEEQEGWAAYWNGDKPDACTYPEGSKEHGDWRTGWWDGEHETWSGRAGMPPMKPYETDDKTEE